MKHVMLDLETMGTRPGSAITQIGAVEFTFDADALPPLGRGFKRTINLQSAIDLGLTVDGATVDWWMQQTEAARQSVLTIKRTDIKRALLEFSLWMEKVKAEFVWGNASTFDNVLLSIAYQKAGLDRPWHYRGDRDMRTLVGLAQDLGFKLDNLIMYEGTLHDALDDAKNQARFVQAIMRLLTTPDHL